MPNWCNNSLTITIDLERGREGFDNFKNTLNTADADGQLVPFSFFQTVPRPAEQNNNWYDWDMRCWGTKWDAVNPIVEYEGADMVHIYFDTAWTPPSRWVQTVAEQFKVLITLDYDELGMDLCGTITASFDEFLDEDRHVEGDVDSDEEEAADIEVVA